MSEENSGGGASREFAAIEEMREANSDAFSILGHELAEVKAMLMVLLDLQKSTILATGMSEEDIERHVETLLEGYRQRFLNALSRRVRSAAQDNT
jgi:sialic acid synthase SpsE